MRPSSVYSTRASHAGSLTSQAANAQQTAKLLEKMKEFDALQALEQASASYVRRIEALSKDCEVMADAGKGPYRRAISRDLY
jgi:DASH complex subunit DAD2